MSDANVEGAIAEIVSVIYLNDSSDYIDGLWDALIQLDEDAATMLENDAEGAYKKYTDEEPQQKKP